MKVDEILGSDDQSDLEDRELSSSSEEDFTAQIKNNLKKSKL